MAAHPAAHPCASAGSMAVIWPQAWTTSAGTVSRPVPLTHSDALRRTFAGRLARAHNDLSTGYTYARALHIYPGGGLEPQPVHARGTRQNFFPKACSRGCGVAGGQLGNVCTFVHAWIGSILKDVNIFFSPSFITRGSSSWLTIRIAPLFQHRDFHSLFTCTILGIMKSSAEHVRDASGGGHSDSNPKHQSWFEKALKPKKINARYPIKGAPLLFATCGFGSLGDALFGYNSGTSL